MTIHWHLITSEFPPDVCGVGDQSLLLAQGLARAGDRVDVYTKESGEAADAPSEIEVHRIFTNYGRGDLERLGDLLDRQPAPRRILVQWVPHGYGFRSMNVLLALWLYRRGRNPDDELEVIVHEPGLGWGGRPAHTIAAVVHRAMLWLALRTARRAWVAIPAWKSRVRPYARRDLEIKWLPATSPVPAATDPARVVDARRKYAQTPFLIGIFGRRPTAEEGFERAIVLLLQRLDDVGIVVLGSESREAAEEFHQRHPGFQGRLCATGVLDAADVASVIGACDLMLQIYPDGVSSRRTSLISALAQGAAIITNEGKHSEIIWRESGAVDLVSGEDPQEVVPRVRRLLDDALLRRRLGEKARALFESRFHISYAIRQLRGGSDE